jgi:hypothetical protein
MTIDQFSMLNFQYSPGTLARQRLAVRNACSAFGFGAGKWQSTALSRV